MSVSTTDSMSSIAVEEAEILQILRDFLEAGGYTECLGALEKHPGAGPRSLSELHELQLVRELILDGRWEQLLSYLQPLDQSGLGAKEDFRKCQYAVAKQRYLENLAKSPKPTVEIFSVGEGKERESSNQRLQRFMAHLQELEQLCPTEEEYSALCNLLTVPSLSAHDQYRSWNMHRSRLECFHTVATWLMKALYPGVKIELPSLHSSNTGLQSNRLTRLLAKGLLYEECETMCAQRCGDGKSLTEILDLCSWMQHQPDSAFQVPPSRLVLSFIPHTGSKTGQLQRSRSPENRGLGRVLALSKTVGETSESLKIFPSTSSQLKSSVQQSLVSHSAPAIHLVDSIAQTPTENPKAAGQDGDPALLSGKRSLQHRQQQSEVPTSGTEQQSQPSTSSQQQPGKEHIHARVKTEETKTDSRSPSKQQNSDCVVADGPVLGSQEPLTQSNPKIQPLPKTLPSPSTQTPTSQPHHTSSQVRIMTTISESQPKLAVEQFEDNFTPMPTSEAELALRTPARITSLIHSSREGRNSSTPKPSTFRPPPQPSPITSPVPYVSGTHGLSDTPYRPTASAQSFGPQQRKATAVSEATSKTPIHPPAEKPQKEAKDAEWQSEQVSARKHINFTGEDRSVQWPTSVLLSTISDPQVVRALAFSQTGEMVAVGANSFSLVFSCSIYNNKWPYRGDAAILQVVRAVAFSQTGEMVAVGANSKTLRLCSTLPLTEEMASDDLPVFYHHPRYHKGSIYCLAWHGDSLLASGSNDQTVKLLHVTHDPSSSTTNCVPQGQLNIHNGTVRGLAFLKNGYLLSGGAGDNILKLSDCSVGKVLCSHTGHSDQILAITVISDTVIASGSQDETVRLWDTRNRRCFHTLKVPSAVASLSAYGDSLAAAHLDGSCTIHNLRTLKLSGSIHAHHDECRAVHHSSSGSWLLTGSYDGRVCLADCESLEWREVGEHQDKVIQCCWHGGGKVFASTGADKKACFWALQ